MWLVGPLSTKYSNLKNNFLIILLIVLCLTRIVKELDWNVRFFFLNVCLSPPRYIPRTAPINILKNNNNNKNYHYNKYLLKAKLYSHK
jgi:hypothetical protein